LRGFCWGAVNSCSMLCSGQGSSIEKCKYDYTGGSANVYLTVGYHRSDELAPDKLVLSPGLSAIVKLIGQIAGVVGMQDTATAFILYRPYDPVRCAICGNTRSRSRIAESAR